MVSTEDGLEWTIVVEARSLRVDVRVALRMSVAGFRLDLPFVRPASWYRFIYGVDELINGLRLMSGSVNPQSRIGPV